MKNVINNSLGTIGSVMLAFCGIPEVIQAFATGKCAMTFTFVFMWWFGEVCVLIPVVRERNRGYLIFNYGVNVTCTTILMGFKVSEWIS